MINPEQTKVSGSKGLSPYLAGALVGVLAIVSVYLTTVYMGKSTYLGASTTFVRAEWKTPTRLGAEIFRFFLWII